MTISAKIIADSISPVGARLTTFQARYPKFIHGELMTHRVFSRNASSSRAIPVGKLIADVRNDPAMPVFWGANQKGMQAAHELDHMAKSAAMREWLKGRDRAIDIASEMAAIGAHKQIVNRVIEPYCHINVVITATDYENFYALRRHPDAQPEIRALADLMWSAQQVSQPMLMHHGYWHLPYLIDDELFGPEDQLSPDDWTPDMVTSFIKVSVARCARVSYMTHEGKPPDFNEDLALYERLVGSKPLHASPAEHQATPDTQNTLGVWHRPYLHGNLRGWIQYRKTLPDEFVPG